MNGRKKRNRRSKLAYATSDIMRWWGQGKSLEFIRMRLESDSLRCHKTTVSRFIKKALSL